MTIGEGRWVDPHKMMRRLRAEAIRTLLCEGGPTLYSELLTARLIDEDFRTLSTQVLGQSTDWAQARPTAYGWVKFVPETAPWFRIISIHLAEPHHLFLRLRYEGPRPAEASFGHSKAVASHRTP